jgi:hypothetical protein
LAVILFSEGPEGRALGSEAAATGSSSDSEAPRPRKWPREFEDAGVLFTVHQPQIDSWAGHRLTARAAVSVTTPDETEPALGTIDLMARAIVDKRQRLVTIEHVNITKANFPFEPDQVATFWKGLSGQIQPLVGTLSLDRLLEQARIMKAGRFTEALPLRNDPPRILFSRQPAILVPIDGKPVYRDIDNTDLKRVINTHVLLLKDASGRFHLPVFDGWMTAPALEGPWTVESEPAAGLDTARALAVGASAVDLLRGPPLTTKPPTDPPSLRKGPVPTIHIATVPTELIVTQGLPEYVPIAGTNLLYVKNTTAHILRDSIDRHIYILVAGRWFRATGLDGPWEYVPGKELPGDFRKIPDDSPKENVKASIPGTPQAREALIAVSIPHMAKVRIGDAKMAPPEFDGEPQLAPIEGTDLEFVANSPVAVIRVADTSFFAVDRGVWFTSSSLDGPWTIATAVPEILYSIPPRSPLHYVTYAYVYGSTPDWVFVGYSPGYFGAYIRDGAIVYGTGYDYAPWIGSVWYGRPATYGYAANITFTPWTGWTLWFGLGWTWSAGPTLWGWGPYPYWGPFRYAFASEQEGGSGRVPLGREGTAGHERDGISYNSRTGLLSSGHGGEVKKVLSIELPGKNVIRSSPLAGGPGSAGNDLFAGQDGEVYRRSDEGRWQRYSGDSWDDLDPGGSQTENDDWEPTEHSWGWNGWGPYGYGYDDWLDQPGWGQSHWAESDSGQIGWVQWGYRRTDPFGPGSLDRDWRARRSGEIRERNFSATSTHRDRDGHP